MKKLKSFRFSKIGNYIKELSIVIIGVAVTLYASNMVSNIKERKDMNLQLNAIYTELEDNLEKVDKLLDYYYRVQQFRTYLIEDYHNPGQVNDSIRKYAGVFGNIQAFVYKKGAYDMFLNSGAMKLLNDRTLLLAISECYTLLEITKEDHNQYIGLKMDLFQQHYASETEIFINNVMDFRHPAFHDLYNFHIAVIVNGGDALDAKEHIEKVLFEHRKNNK